MPPSREVGLASAPDLLRHEAEAIGAAADALDAAELGRAVELLATCSGKAAVTGVGTSGIIARKLAATLTSTGTPAVFVHPSDALHGGLGVLEPNDVVVAVSNSGETDEVLAVLPYLRSREISIVAIVGNTRSTLGRNAAAVLNAHVGREVGSLDFVPTASAAVATALGDVLALLVMERKGVTPERFALNHPSGRLGRRLSLRVRDVMHSSSEAPGVGPDAPWYDLVSEITRSGVGAVPVVDGDRLLLGLITDGDVRRTVQRCKPEDLSTLRADRIMTSRPVATGPETMAYEALRLMEDRPSQISVLPVVEDGQFVGLVRLHDLVRIGL
ncbi:MAG: KpsF/GutQ family sugar-phosphate isomerase [Actinomycetota bacterium]|nr:KpsF/GutQ family sugar-phosphate isomerase [Actinomycetota bacterium]